MKNNKQKYNIKHLYLLFIGRINLKVYYIIILLIIFSLSVKAQVNDDEISDVKIEEPKIIEQREEYDTQEYSNSQQVEQTDDTINIDDEIIEVEDSEEPQDNDDIENSTEAENTAVNNLVLENDKQSDTEENDTEIEIDLVNDTNTNNITTNTNDTANVTKKQPKKLDTSKGLFIDSSFVGSYNPINVGLDLKVFYRCSNIIKSTNDIFKGNYIDVGFRNEFKMGNNMAGVYADFIATTFMQIDAGIYYNVFYNIDTFNAGYIGFDNTDIIFADINAVSSGSSSGYIISVAPKFYYTFKTGVTIENRTEINLLGQSGNSPYYIDKDKYIFYKSNDLEIINQISILTIVNLFKVGPSYSILYVVGSKQFAQSIDINLSVSKYFLNNSLFLHFDLKSGWNLSHPYYANTVYFEGKLGIRYQIL